MQRRHGRSAATHRLTGAVLALGFALASPAAAIETAEEIEDCVRSNRPNETSIQTVVFKARDRTGEEKQSRARVYWKRFADDRSKVLIRVSEPIKSRGAGLLLVEGDDKTDRFLYLPALRKVRRITKSSSSGALLGTDFSSAELEQWQNLRDDSEPVRLDDDVVAGKPVWVIQIEPNDSGYERIVSSIDKETCVALKVEYYDRGDQLHKVMTVEPDQVSLESGLHIPRKLLMTNLFDETSTELVVEEIEIDPPVRDKVFSKKELAVGRR